MDKIQNDVLTEAIEKAFWKDVLYEILSSMDPWDVDIVELSNRYLKKVKEMKNLNFRIPTNVLIVCSVLLRMKADILKFKEEVDENEYETPEEESDLIELESEEISGINSEGITSEISLIPKRVLSRRVTAEELISAIQSVLETQPKRRKKISLSEPIVIETREDFKNVMEEVYQRICELLSKKEKVKFSEITDKENLVKTFISIIFLSNNQKLKLEQQKIYEEIYIRK